MASERDEGGRPARSLTGRVVAGVSSQAFARLAAAVTTIATVPMMIRAWGVGGFGEWIALGAVSSYFGYANLGLVTTAGNEMIMALGAADLPRARKAFQMAVNVALYLVLPLLALVAAAVALLPLESLLNLKVVTHAEAVLIVALASAQLWFATLRGIVAGSLYAQGSYSLAYVLTGIAKLAELAALGIVVGVLQLNLTSAAFTVCAIALLDLTVITVLARRSRFRPSPDPRHFDRSWLLSHVKPSIGFLLSDFATQGVLVQGPRVVLSMVLGGPAVAVYAVYATAMRLTDQIVQMVAMPLHVEIAYSAGQNDLRRTYGLIVFGTQFGWIALLGVSCGLLLLGPFVFGLWTRGQIGFDHLLMSCFLCMAAANLLGRISAEALISTNRMFETAPLMPPLALAGIGIGAALAPGLGVAGMVVGGILGELAISALVVRAMARWLGIERGVFRRDLLELRPLVQHVSRLGSQVASRIRHKRL